MIKDDFGNAQLTGTYVAVHTRLARSAAVSKVILRASYRNNKKRGRYETNDHMGALLKKGAANISPCYARDHGA